MRFLRFFCLAADDTYFSTPTFRAFVFIEPVSAVVVSASLSAVDSVYHVYNHPAVPSCCCRTASTTGRTSTLSPIFVMGATF